MTRSFCLIGILLMSAVLAPTALWAEPPPVAADTSLAELIDILTERGLLSAEEQQALRERIAAEEQLAAAPETAPAPEPAPAEPEYPTLRTKIRLETRFSSVQEDENQPYFGSRDDRTGGDGFAVRRARFYLMGDLRPETGYKIQYQSDWGHDKVNLHVAQMEWRGWDCADLVAGQLQAPFGYEIVTSDAYLLCIDRAAVSNFLPADKDIGLRLDSTRPILGGLQYQLFMGNGSGKRVGNPNSSYLWAARLTANPTPELSVGASYSSNRNTDFSPYQSRFLAKNGDPYGLLPAYTAAQADETSWEADFQWRRGSLMVWGEYIRTEIDPGSGTSVEADGYYLDAHYVLPYRGARDKLGLILGYQRFDPNRAVSDQYDLAAYTLGFNYHLQGGGHSRQGCGNMFRLNYVWMEEAQGEVDNDKLILQYQTFF